MSEATGHEARTLHRLLEYSMKKGGFQKDQKHPLPCDLLIVDEASMISQSLMNSDEYACALHGQKSVCENRWTV